MGKKEYVKAFTLYIPIEEWERVKELKDKKRKEKKAAVSYVEIILDAINFFYEKQKEGTVSVE